MTAVTFGDLFDRMVDVMGAETAADVTRQAFAYRDGHSGCDLPGGVEIVDDGTDVHVPSATRPTVPPSPKE